MWTCVTFRIDKKKKNNNNISSFCNHLLKPAENIFKIDYPWSVPLLMIYLKEFNVCA